MKFFFLILAILISSELFSQEKKYNDLGILIKVQGDSIARRSIDLKEITIYPQLEFNSFEEKVMYYTIKRKTLKVYPYAILASKRLTQLKNRIPLIKTKI